METSQTFSCEPEEALEAAVSSLIAPFVTFPISGFLSPSTDGTAKLMSSDSFISVMADQSSQDLDRKGVDIPRTMSLSVIVKCAQCDSPDGSVFRDECRRVRSALHALTGDGCDLVTTASQSALKCDGFILDSTSSYFSGDDNPTFSKTYSATVKARTSSEDQAQNEND